FAHGRGKGVGRHGKGNHEGGKEGHERSTVIDGVAGCAWRTFRIRRFAPALVSASAILRRGWPEGGRNPWTSVRKIKHAGENAGLPPQCAVLRGARPALTATLSISCRFPAGTLGLAGCCAIMAGLSASP